MRTLLFFAAVSLTVGLLFTVDRPSTRMQVAPHTGVSESVGAAESLGRGKTIAAYPDQGQLFAYDRERKVVRSGSSTWHPVQISEAHALRAIAEGAMTVPAPNGENISLRYDRHVEHSDGNWTWVGREDGSTSGTETVLTFGEKAVFGTIRQANADLKVTTEDGSAWLVETDYSRGNGNRLAANADDVLVPVGMPKPEAVSMPDPMRAASAPVTAADSTASTTTVDIAMGFTTGFSARLGGQSQARTRLNFLVDATNQAYLASGINAQIRLVHALQVDYPDATNNRATLFDLTGVDCTTQTNGTSYLSDRRVECTPVTQSAGLQPLTAARNTYGADLLVLVRKFESPEQGSCGSAWMLGGGQNQIDASSAAFGMTVVSDSSAEMFPDEGATCPEVMLAHELGHNMGQQHDLVTAMGADDSDSDGNLLDPEEFGRHAYSFGHSTDGTGSDIATIMSSRRLTQTRYRVFSSPLISSCGGAPCGTAQSDNARSMSETMPIVAAFRATGGASETAAAPSDFDGDLDGDGRADVYWRNSFTGDTGLWRMSGTTVAGAWNVHSESDISWAVAGSGDFNADGRADVLWRNWNSGQVYIHFMNGPTILPESRSAPTVGDLAWKIVGVADFDGDAITDLYWRNVSTGLTYVWLMNGAEPKAMQPAHHEPDQGWRVAGTGDFNGDGRADVLWRHSVTGQNYIHMMSGASILPSSGALPTVTEPEWKVMSVGDFNADTRADIYWRNSSTGECYLWLMDGVSLTSMQRVHSAALSWNIASSGDFNGDGRTDIFWRNSLTGENYLHLMDGASILGGSGTVFDVSDLNWKVAIP
jgi:peptidyl-Asp metalloendopeptidase